MIPLNLHDRLAVADVVIVDGTFMVLGTNFWPLGPQQTDFAVPHEIQKTYDSFTKFYSEQHSSVSTRPSFRLVQG